VGIGSAPNSFLMTRAAEIGRGTFTHIGSVDQVQERMRELIEKLESPIVTGLTASYTGGAMDATPDALPDLYRGEPIVIAAKLGAPDGVLEIKGMIGNRPWTVTLPVAKAAEGMGLSKLWARRKITDAEMAHRLGQASAEETDKRILTLALEHHLVSRLTSLVAVDATPSRPEGTRLTRAELPLNLPAGWDFDKVFGTERKGSDTPAPQPLERRADAGNLSAPAKRTAATAAAGPLAVAAAQPGGVVLPKTATDAELKLMAGLLLLALSFLLALRRRPTATRRIEEEEMTAVPPAPTTPSSRRRPLRLSPATAAALALAGLWLIGDALYIHAKAMVAQVLLERAFAAEVAPGAIVKPWSWADTWPVARIEVPRLAAHAIVLAGGSGQALAFGPGHLERTPDAGELGTAVYAAHRDTHFAFLGQIKAGDEIVVTRRDGATARFRITHMQVVRWDSSGIDPAMPGRHLALVTCWPLDSAIPGPLRYVVRADLIT
jgi:sortase